MAINNFKPFAIGNNANVTSQADYEVLAALVTGFQAGKASSAQVNKAIRQATFIAAAVAQYVSDALAQDVLDDGNSQALVMSLKQAIINGSVPAGVPMPWPAAIPPAGWLKCNGSDFNTTTYPLLAKAYPSGRLPDLRGEFIRGWDDGRGSDAGRKILTAQEATGLRTGALDYPGVDATSDGSTIGTAFRQADTATTNQPYDAQKPAGGALDATLADNLIYGRQNNVALLGSGSLWISVRPRNTAFNYIVRAA